MLVLTRKLREAVVIGGDSNVPGGITVTVLEVRGGKVKLGFTADPGVSIQRSEVWERIHTGDSSERNTEEMSVADNVVMPGGLFLTGASARMAGISFKEKQ
jgi:carbon storage regulator CsrA